MVVLIKHCHQLIHKRHRTIRSRAILDSKKIRGKQHFLVERIGYDNDENTLKPSETSKMIMKPYRLTKNLSYVPLRRRRAVTPNFQFPLCTLLSFLYFRNIPSTFSDYLIFSLFLPEHCRSIYFALLYSYEKVLYTLFDFYFTLFRTCKFWVHVSITWYFIHTSTV